MSYVGAIKESNGKVINDLKSSANIPTSIISLIVTNPYNNL